MNRALLTQICTDIQDLLLRKNADYGNSYFELRNEFGKVAFVIRLADKFSRIKNLATRSEQHTDETEEDTIKDIVGYCLLELYYRKFYRGDKNDQ